MTHGSNLHDIGTSANALGWLEVLGVFFHGTIEVPGSLFVFVLLALWIWRRTDQGKDN